MDLALLGFEFDGSGADAADRAFHKVATGARGVEQAVSRAEDATDRLANAARRSNGATEIMNVSIMQQTAALGATRASMGLTAAEGLNLSRQFADIGVTAAMGMNPLMIALQQGPQLLDAFQMAAMRAGTSIRASMVATGAAVWTAMAPLLPVIAAIAAAAGTVAGAFGLATRAVREDIGDVTETMRLTEAQLRTLKEQGVDTGVTMGDVFRGAGTTIKQGFFEMFGREIEVLGRTWDGFLDAAWQGTITTSKIMSGAFVGSFYVVRDTWGLLPLALGDATMTAVRAVLSGVETLVNRGIDGINRLIRAAKSLGPLVPFGGAMSQVNEIPHWIAGLPDNRFAGALRATGQEMGRSWSEGWFVATSAVDRTAGAMVPNIRASRDARVMGALGDSGARGAAGARQSAAPGLEQITLSTANPFGPGEPLRILSDDMITPLEALAKELRMIDGLAGDVSRGLSSAFGQSGQALGDLLTVTTRYQSVMAEIALAEQERRMDRAQAMRAQAQAEMGAYGDMAAAARGFFKEGSDGYQILQAAEQAFRLVQLAGMVQAMMLDTQMTGTSVGNSLARGGALAAEGAARMFAMLGPYAFPVVAGMVALLASMGIRSGGGRSSGGSFNPGPINDGSAQRVQAPRAEPQAARQPITFDLRNAVVTSDLLREMEGMAAESAGVSVRVSRGAARQDRRKDDRMRLGGRAG
ncbi:MAG: phage tail length tape measure family protein [Caulobacteraceae bacterium]|nr:phage tail length tape measure family protein [Caulobacteraceae bacterium]